MTDLVDATASAGDTADAAYGDSRQPSWAVSEMSADLPRPLPPPAAADLVFPAVRWPSGAAIDAPDAGLSITDEQHIDDEPSKARGLHSVTPKRLDDRVIRPLHLPTTSITALEPPDLADEPLPGPTVEPTDGATTVDAEPVEPDTDAVDAPTLTTMPTLTTGPDAILAVEQPTAAGAPNGDAPAWSAAAPPMPQPAPAPAAAPLSYEALVASGALGASTAKRPRGGTAAGFVKKTVGLAAVGGIVWAGLVFGPDAYDRFVADDDSAAVVEEPAAPMAFPVPRNAPEVRTATFRLDGLTDDSSSSYTVTTDFETTVSQVIIDRSEAPDLEILTFFNDALVRRVDSEQWYQMDRGRFPLDDELDRASWVRTIDELLPPETRQMVSIDRSTTATVGTIETRHLVVTLEPALLDRVAVGGDQLLDPSDISQAADPVAPAPAPAPAPPPPAPEAAPTTAPPDAPLATPTPTTAAVGADQPSTAPDPGRAVSPADTTTIELWIDADGLIRRASGAPQLGAETITVLNTSTEAWIPPYPEADGVLPLTASALVQLGL